MVARYSPAPSSQSRSVVPPPAVVTTPPPPPPPADKPDPRPALPTQKEKDALIASLSAQKDTFPSMTLHSFSPCQMDTFLFLLCLDTDTNTHKSIISTPPPPPLHHHQLTHTFSVFLFFPLLHAVDQLTKCPMCDRTFDDPRTLPCLHSFCLACLEAQKAGALTPSSDLRCHTCRVPFTPPAVGGVGAYTCSAFIDSLVKAARANQGDVNRVIRCDFCENEDATMHCVECSENFCPTCSNGHHKSKMSSTHRQIPLEEALSGNTPAIRIPRCQRHVVFEIDSYCKTCDEAICARCGIEKHPKHDFCPLSQVTAPLQDQIAGYTVALTKREEEARRAVTTLQGAITSVEEHRSAAEREITAFVSALHAAVDARGAVLVSEMQSKGDQLRKTATQGKSEAESATIELSNFHTFTEGLLAQGTPLEIAGIHKMVRA